MSRMFRAKKFFASRMSDTKAGRSAILKYVGVGGDNLVRLLKAAMVQYASRDTAKALKKDLMKLSSKLAILYQEGRIQDQDGEALGPVALEIGRRFVALCQRPPASITAHEIDGLAASIGRLHDDALPLLLKHMKPANAARLTHLKDAFADKVFLATLLKGAAYKDLRSAFGGTMASMIQTAQGGGATGPSQACVLSGCMLPRTVFPGSAYCNPHHYQHFRARVAYPRLEDFLRSQHFSKLWRTFADEKGFSDHYALWSGVEDYRGVSNRSLRPRRAEVLFTRYLAPAAPNRVPGLREETVAAVDAAILDGVKSTTFNQAQAEALQMMEHAFANGFVRSKYFREFVQQVGMSKFAAAHPVRPVLVHIPHPGPADREALVPWVDGAATPADVAADEAVSGALTLGDVPPEFHPPAGLQFSVPEDSDDDDDDEAGSGAAAGAAVGD